VLIKQSRGFFSQIFNHHFKPCEQQETNVDWKKSTVFLA
jgi:hypothetical protein